MNIITPPIKHAEDHIKVYIAARYNGHRANPNAPNANQAKAGAEPYPYHLESYHYTGNGRYDDLIRSNHHRMFMDSGAFSAFTLGATINLDKYARYLTNCSDYIEVASNVDVIGAGMEKESYDNQKALESMKLPVQVCPVHHARDRDEWLVRYLDAGYDYLFLGGMVPETTGYLIDWLDHIWDKYLALPDGTARIKVHGFGLTTFELMDRYPWYSVDSTSWVMISMFGNIIMNIKGKPRAISLSEKSSSLKQENKSFWNMDKPTQDHLRAIIVENGFTPEDLAANFGARDSWNIRFFNRYMERDKPLFERRAVTFF